MAERKVLLRQDAEAQSHARPWGPEFAYRVTGWVGGIMTLAALSDFALALYPSGFGSPEWEMATVGAVFQGLPLLSIGLAAVWVSAGGAGQRGLLLTLGAGLLLGAVLLGGAMLLFLTDLPQAVRATQGVSRMGIYKLATRTLFMGFLFGSAYVAAAVLALKQTRKSI